MIKLFSVKVIVVIVAQLTVKAQGMQLTPATLDTGKAEEGCCRW